MVAMVENVASLKEDVDNFYALYAEIIGDDRLEEWPNLFTEKCLYKVISRENHDRGMPAAAIFCDSRGMLVDRIVSLRHANIYPEHFVRHVIGPIRLTSVRDGVIHTQANYAIFQTRNDGVTTLYNVGKYVDEIVRADGRLLFKSKIAVFDTNMIETVMVKPI
jgi:anthranilate 1,2-dioxygenase small subunit